MSLGYDRPLYILPFDHRGSFQKKMFGWPGELTPEQTAEMARTKEVIYDGFKAALAAGVAKEKAGILIDEQFGSKIIRDAVAQGYTVALTIEKSGQDEFDFEYGADFGKHIKALNPTFGKVLVRYNPEGDRDLNARQNERLKRLSEWLHKEDYKYVFELLVPATDTQLESVKGDKKAYEQKVRPRLMVQAVHQIQEAGIEPDVWKIEGLDRREDCAKVAQAVRRGGRDRVGCIVLGRGEDDKKVREWLAAAAGVPGYIGFAVGRTTFWDALQDWRAGKIERSEAVSRIGTRYRGFVDLFESAT